MAEDNDADAQRSAVREAEEHGGSPSAAGVTTGASKQTDHATHGQDRYEHGGSSGPGKS